ncbi:MAG: hypothetical protein ACREVZ_01770 [Burkholderiales bacterium]
MYRSVSSSAWWISDSGDRRRFASTARLFGESRAFGDEGRATQRFVKGLQLAAALLKHPQRMPLDEPKMAEVALQCGQVVEQPVLAPAVQQPLRLIKRGAQWPVRPHNVHHWVHVTLHPVDDAPELVAHGNHPALGLVARHLGHDVRDPRERLKRPELKARPREGPAWHAEDAMARKVSDPRLRTRALDNSLAQQYLFVND